MRHNRFLVIRPDRIGDVVLSTPLPKEIRKAIPSAYVAVMVTEYTRDIYLNNPDVDEIITFPGQQEKVSAAEFFRLVSLLRKRNFDTAFMLLPAARVNYLLFAAGIKLRIGVGHKFYQFITNTKSVYRRKYIPLRHEADYCLDMLRKIGIDPSPPEPEIYLSQAELSQVNLRKQELNPGGKIHIGINSTSGNSAPNITVSEYRKLIDNFLHDGRFSVSVTDYNPPPVIDNIGGVSYPCRGKKLRESIIAFASLDLLISASTGPMHIASALKVPVLSLFCPLTACSPKLWGPLGTKARIILPDKDYCSVKCPGDPKKCNFSGEGGIDSGKILHELDLFMTPAE